MIDDPLAHVGHVFHEARAARPAAVGLNVVDLLLAVFGRGAADCDVLERSAEAAHAVAFEVGENEHGVVVEEVLADHDFLEMQTALDRQRRIPEFVHDVDLREGPAVFFEHLAVTRRRLTRALVENVALDDGALRNRALQRLDPGGRQNVRTLGLARVEFERDLAGEFALYEIDHADEGGFGNLRRPVDDRTGIRLRGRGHARRDEGRGGHAGGRRFDELPSSPTLHDVLLCEKCGRPQDAPLRALS